MENPKNMNYEILIEEAKNLTGFLKGIHFADEDMDSYCNKLEVHIAATLIIDRIYDLVSELNRRNELEEELEMLCLQCQEGCVDKGKCNARDEILKELGE